MRELLKLARNLESLNCLLFTFQNWKLLIFLNTLLVTEFLYQNKEEYVSDMDLIANTEEQKEYI